MTAIGIPLVFGRFVSASDSNGNVMPAQSLADFQAANPSATVYVATADFSHQYGGVITFVNSGQPIVVTPDLLAYLTSISAPIQYAWGNPINLSTAAASMNVGALFGHIF